MLQALETGRGFAIIDGVPVDRLSTDESQMMYWLIGQVRRRTPKFPIVENTISLLSPFLAYIPADWLGLSGILAVQRLGQVIHHGVGDPDRCAVLEGQRQALGQVRRDLRRAGGAIQPDPCHRQFRAQLVNVHRGDPGPGGVQQPAGQAPGRRGGIAALALPVQQRLRHVDLR